MKEVKDVQGECTGYEGGVLLKYISSSLVVSVCPLVSLWLCCIIPLFLAKRISAMRVYFCCQDMQHAPPDVCEYLFDIHVSRATCLRPRTYGSAC